MVVGDGRPSLEQVRALPYTTRVISEAMRLYPQPPVLIRRALEEDNLGGYTVAPGSDLFISVWNLHRSCITTPSRASHPVTEHVLSPSSLCLILSLATCS